MRGAQTGNLGLTGGNPPAGPSHQEQVMSNHPYVTSQLISDRHRARIASAEQHRLTRQLRASARTPRPAGRFARHLRWPLRIAVARRTETTA